MQRLYSAGAAALLVALASAPAGAQSLRAKLTRLVTFGPWDAPLRVGAVSPDGQRIEASDAFVAAPNGAIVSFLVTWMGANAASAPLASTGGGTAFAFAGGTPVAQAPAPGPVFGEPATTMGRRALLAGANVTDVRFTRVRGVPLGDVRLTLTQDGAGVGDALDVRVDVDYRMTLTTLFATLGVHDRVDVGVVLPVVRTALRGGSTARVVPAAGRAPGAAGATVLGGTPDAPVLVSRQRMDGAATGIGDVALRAKANLIDRPGTAIGVLTDVRLPTGDEDNLLGSGSLAVRAMALYSGRLGLVTPHLSAGYLHYTSAPVNDAALVTAGLERDLTARVTLAASVLGQFHAGPSSYRLPSNDGGAPRTNIPEIRDDAVSGSLGVKVRAGRVRGVVNALAPFTRGGPRPDAAYTAGVEVDF